MLLSLRNKGRRSSILNFNDMKTKVVKIDPQNPDIAHIQFCSEVIMGGGLVIFPTDTVYGIAADLLNVKAVQRLRDIKQRSENKPFSIIISQQGLIANYTSSTSIAIYKLIDMFWPGPLTIVVPSKNNDGSTVGLRMPSHNVALSLAQETRCMMIAPSANVEGRPPPQTCEEALVDLDGLVDLAIDSGPSSIGRGSTVVDMTGQDPVILRQGEVKEASIKECVQKKTIMFICTGNSCRSVMAEYLLKEMVKDRKNVEVISAGTNVFLETTASTDTINVLEEEGIDARDHISRSVNTMAMKRADLILVMTRLHRMQVLERVSSVEERVYLLKEFANAPIGGNDTMDVSDPMGGDYNAYKECKAVIQQALKKVVELI